MIEGYFCYGGASCPDLVVKLSLDGAGRPLAAVLAREKAGS